MKSNIFAAVVAVASFVAIAPEADAVVINSLFERTSSDGDHIDFPGSRAVVSDRFNENHRGITEFDITSLGSFLTATLSFTMTIEVNNPFNIRLRTFAGNGVFDLAGDFSGASTPIASFSNAGPVIGDVFSFDVTSEVLAATDFIGFRLQRRNNPPGSNNRAVFRNFQITTTVSEPGTLAMLGLGLAGLGLATRRRSGSSAL